MSLAAFMSTISDEIAKGLDKAKKQLAGPLGSLGGAAGGAMGSAPGETMSFHNGGKVRKTGIAKVKKGEFVLTKKQAYKYLTKKQAQKHSGK